MALDINTIWEVLKVIQGSSGDVTDALESIAKNEKTISEKLFSNIIDQKTFSSADYTRIRNFLRDLYAALRTNTSFQANISDIYQIQNDELDNLFQSFGYNYSTSLRNDTNNPPLDKINFFLDLVNLYKIKGTPQALIDVLKYYGIIDVDLYELSLQYDDRLFKDNSALYFKGKVTAGTTNDKSPIYLPFNLLTESDPHWIQTESKIRQLLSSKKINFPSQSPYFAIKPLFDEEATDASTGILSRKVQDQYWNWQSSGIPPTRDTTATITGDQVSLLELYLACIYMFNQTWIVGSYAPRFVCYDGTNSDSTLIMEEFRTITEAKVESRASILTRWQQYIDIFTRDIPSNFLQNPSDAQMILSILNPTFKSNLDLLATDSVITLGTLLNDLGNWVRNNISFGFINMSYILFGLDSLFSQLRSIIEFFKPYRARLIPLEMLQLRNRLFNSIVVEDVFNHSLDTYFVDFLTGNSIPCCASDDTSCISVEAEDYNPIYSREHFDCGSNFDLGAVTDTPRELFIEYSDIVRDNLRCPISDTTGFVVSEMVSDDIELAFSVEIPIDSTTVDIVFDKVFTTTDYIVNASIYNDIDTNPSQFSYIVSQKTTNGFVLTLSGEVPTENYSLYYSLNTNTDSSCCDITHLVVGSREHTINLLTPMSNTNYCVSAMLVNITDTNPSIYTYNIINKTTTSFTIEFSSELDSNFYYLEWTVSSGSNVCSVQVPYDSTSLVVTLPHSTTADYSLIPILYNNIDSSASQYSFIITDKDDSSFTILFSSGIDSSNFSLDWFIESDPNYNDSLFLYSQSGGFRDFDSEGTFDCTHGFDLFQIRIDSDFTGYLLQEDYSYLLQEDGSKIVL